MDTLFRQLTSREVFKKIYHHFAHPGILIFRGRELVEVQRYMRKYPAGMASRILDLGCAEGYIGNMLFNKIDVGLDLGIEELKKAKQQPAYRNFVAADARNIPFKAEAFDIIFSNSVIEHIAELDRVLDGVSRVLADQGLFIFTVPSDEFAKNLYFVSFFKKMS
ncbi:MAG: class I SAM-dependent methyltransferase, partial [Candidatus Omnitrophica bacterium]|nr:class I SAM-dependent methyltransferase [Candidatus Omnitrophota bacterium]